MDQQIGDLLGSDSRLIELLLCKKVKASSVSFYHAEDTNDYFLPSILSH